MPVHAGHDYETARALRQKGLTYVQIAQQTGIPSGTVAKYAKRRGWDATIAKAGEMVSRNVSQVLGERAKSHLLKLSAFTDLALDALIAKDAKNLKLNELNVLATAADTFDKIARRTYGLDAEHGKPATLAVQVNIAGTHASALLSAPLDAETVIDAELLPTTATTPTSALKG